MIYFRIKELLAERGIKKPQYEPFVKAGISKALVEGYFSGKKQDIARAHIEIFCRILRCEPNDLFEWRDDKKVPIDDQHPLHKIKPRKPFRLEDELIKLTPDEIRELFEKKKKEDEEKDKKDKDDKKK